MPTLRDERGRFLSGGRGAIGLSVRTRTDMKKLLKKARRANIRSLGHAAGYLRKTAQRSIRKSPQVSAPGQPPHTRKGRLRRSILYDVEKNRQGAVIGPVRYPGPVLAQPVPSKLERGVRRHVIPARKFTAADFLKYGYGPMDVNVPGRGRSTWTEKGKVPVVRGRVRTQAQARRAARLHNTWGIGGRPPKPLAERPYMVPALEKVRPRLPRHWADSVR